MIVEGVHLDPDFVKHLARKYPLNCIPFLIYVKEAQTHKERFAVRVSDMSIRPEDNKYIKNYLAIEHIQQNMLERAK